MATGYFDQTDDRLFETIIGSDGKKKRIARDGAVLTVRTKMMDSANNTKPVRISDGSGNPLSLCKPG